MKITDKRDKKLRKSQIDSEIRGLERMLVLKGGFAITMKVDMLGGLNTKFMSRLQ